ncbi:MAG TPA: MaoC family dehydratase [Bacillota bacterium]
MPEARAVEPGALWRLGPVTISQAAMTRYSQALAEPGYERNIHTDEAVARAAGLPGPIMEGRMGVSLISGLLGQTFGDAWLGGGALSVRFVRMVPAGEALTACARLQDVRHGEQGAELHLEVWCETANGERPIVGEAWLPAAAPGGKGHP